MDNKHLKQNKVDGIKCLLKYKTSERHAGLPHVFWVYMTKINQQWLTILLKLLYIPKTATAEFHLKQNASGIWRILPSKKKDSVHYS